MTNVPVGPNRVNPTGQSAGDAPQEPWRESVSAASRSAGNSFRTPHQGEKPKGKKFKFIILGIGIALLALLLFVGWSLRSDGPNGHIDRSKYQAVFFTNGQVYFGKLRSIDGGYYALTDVFYIQAQAAPSASDDSKNPQKTSESASDVQLIKLGNEVHGPDDEMIISQQQVLFFENLKKDGKVTESITQYRSQKQ